MNSNILAHYGFVLLRFSQRLYHSYDDMYEDDRLIFQREAAKFISLAEEMLDDAVNYGILECQKEASNDKIP